ncbi:GTP pyrophosphokinase [Halotydeus destructor]|nr:GTP pyrophosphokinase [Halotydeus destructor]
MDGFCKSKFWDYVTWYTDSPDFTPCFHDTALVWAPCAFLWLSSPLEIYRIRSTKLSVDRIPWTLIAMLKVVLAVSLAFLSSLEMPNALADDTENIHNIADTIGMRLLQNHIESKITYRLKSPQSILGKIVRKGLDIEKITDIIALRIIVDKEVDCYNSLGIISQIYEINSEESKDFIINPKQNGYQSLHVTISNILEARSVEVQIRTNDMHRVAESGKASHNEYKQKQSQEITELFGVINNNVSLDKAYNIMREFDWTLLDLVNYEQEMKNILDDLSEIRCCLGV